MKVVDRTVKYNRDFKQNEQGFNFLLIPIGKEEYEDRLKEIVVPESIFNKILAMAQDYDLLNLSKMEYDGGISYHNVKLERIIDEFNILISKTDEPKTKKYLKLIVSMLRDGRKADAYFEVIGL